jgi:hypothetical protein
MRNLSAAQNQQFRGPSTQLCWAWRLVRKDGRRLGFTNHDTDISFGGLKYEAKAGFDAGALEQDIGFSVNSARADGLFSSDLITPQDLRAGLYDGADIDLFRLDWRDASSALHVAHWTLGDVTLGAAGFEAELIGRTAKLDRSTGRVFSRYCDAELGDRRCGLNLADFPNGTTCPRSFQACREQFNNTHNFRGFPYLLGDDALARGPQTGETLDGGSRYS